MSAMRQGLLVLALAVTGAACARAQGPESAGAESDSVPPTGYGSLTQNDIAVRLRTDAIEVRFVPLDERILRLLAPDAYRSLRALAVSRRRSIDSVAGRNGVSEPGVALVSFFGLQPGARFDPQLLTITVRSRLLYPIGIVPLSQSFSSQQLGVRQQASALYVFDEELPVAQPMGVAYASQTSDEWERRLNLFERERARVSARARADTRRERPAADTTDAAP